MVDKRNKKLDFTYHWNYIPERLSKLYWNGPIFAYGTLIAIWLIFMLISLLLGNHKYTLWVALISSGILILFNFLWYQKRKNKLETNVLKGLPKGWHLIYRSNFGGKHYIPHLVFESEYKRLLKAKKSWWKFDPRGIKIPHSNSQIKTRKSTGIGFFILLMIGVGLGPSCFGENIPSLDQKASSLNFIRPCNANHGDYEKVESIVSAPNNKWYLINYKCWNDTAGSSSGLWFKMKEEKDFRQVASYERLLYISPNRKYDWLLIADAFASGESTAYLLPVSSFVSKAGIVNQANQANQVDVEGMSIDNPSGFIDLQKACGPYLPEGCNGRTELEVAWLDNERIGIYIKAKGEDEKWCLVGTFIYSLKSNSISAVKHLPVVGLDWQGDTNLEGATELP